MTLVGISLKIDLTEDDRLELAYLNIQPVKIGAIWYLTPKRDPSAPQTGLFGHEYQYFINQLKRVKNHIYTSYNDDFGLLPVKALPLNYYPTDQPST